MATNHRQIVHLFDEVGENGPKLLGGKGAGLCTMVQAGFPVPPGFIIETGVSRAYRQESRLPSRLSGQLGRAMSRLEGQSGKVFGGVERPLLLSVRSGAPVSMPGMMDTVLNLGLNRETLYALIGATGDERFARDTYRRFLESFGATVLGVPKESFESALAEAQAEADGSEFSAEDLRRLCQEYRRVIKATTGAPMIDDPWEQLRAAIEAVCRSWQSERAVAYRQAHGIAETLGTAVVVMAMVFGNTGSASGTGVVFSRDVATGQPGLYGEYLQNAQGEDVVAGVRTPEAIAKLAIREPALYGELSQLVKKLEIHHSDVVDVEFTVERGRLYLLQVRRAKRTPIAAVRIAVDLVAEGLIDEKEAVRRVSEEQLAAISRPSFEKEAFNAAAGNGRFLVQGLPASGGAAIGQVCFCPARAKQLAEAGEKVVLVRKDTAPEDFPGMLASVAMVTATGGATCHAAVVARGLGRPAVVGATGLAVGDRCAQIGAERIEEGEIISVDGTTGMVVRGEIPLTAGSADGKVTTFLSWVATHRPHRAKVDFDLAAERWCVNTILNDFYLADALRHAAAGTGSLAEAEALYRKVERQTADRFAVYLLVAVAGELRHSWRNASVQPAVVEELARLEAFGVDRSKDRFSAQGKVLSMLRGLSEAETLAFLETGITVFRRGQWSKGYGGEKWGAIAETLLAYLRLELPPALFVDRTFDLQHNGGSVFDKNPMVTDLTLSDTLRGQLDAKKSCTGGVLELAKDLQRHHTTISPEVLLLLERVSGEKVAVEPETVRPRRDRW